MTEKRKLRVSENRVLRRLSGPTTDEVKRMWRGLQKNDLHALYSSPNIILVIKSRRMRREGHIARTGESTGAYRVSVGKPEGSRPLG